jgi:hypothetical protein
VLAGSLRLSNPDVANSIPDGADKFLVDLGTRIRDAQPWQIAQDLSDYVNVALIITFFVGAAVVLTDPDRRRGVIRLGLTIVISGALLFVATFVLPVVAGSFATARLHQRAFQSGAGIFLSTLRTTSIFLAVIGVILCALGVATRPTRGPLTTREVWDAIRVRIESRRATNQAMTVFQSLLIIIAGLAVILLRDALAPLAVFLAGIYVVYLGTVKLLVVVGRPSPTTARREIADQLRNRSFRNRTGAIVGVAVAMIAFVVVAAIVATSVSRSTASADGERKCNGHASLCDKRIDQVAFAGSHNSMSAASDAGWLFAEQSHGIPSQLEFGVRALLVKTHYGIPTSVTVTGTDLVVTDRVAEFAANPTAVQDQLPPGEQATAKVIETAPNVDPNLRDVYLCHVYCEYGSIKFTTALGYVRQFLAENPNEVIILFVGDYVSKEDTEKAFRSAKLFDRLWEYDPSAPLPTLGEMIDAKRNIMLVSENSGPPPAWNVPGYGIFQDTPYTFPTVAGLLTPGAPGFTGADTVTGRIPDTVVEPDPTAPTGSTTAFSPDWTGLPSCRPNRGTPSSPLFEINHFVTPAGGAPTVQQARVVNAYDVLQPRVANCRTQRGLFPNIVAVNFAEVGDLLRVVDDLNGVR